MNFTEIEAVDYLKLLVYSIDFRSEYTVTHTINTTAISAQLGLRLGMSEFELAQLYYGAFLHDIGKIAIPLNILEFEGKLTDEQMEIMKTHVLYTDRIIRGLVSENIRRIAVHHHEKIDGSGYPYGLSGSDLSVAEKIVAVADIVSALTSQRSYKERYPAEKTKALITQLRDNHKLDADICNTLLKNYDAIMRETDATRDPVIQLYNSIAAEYTEISTQVGHQCINP